MVRKTRNSIELGKSFKELHFQLVTRKINLSDSVTILLDNVLKHSTILDKKIMEIRFVYEKVNSVNRKGHFFHIENFASSTLFRTRIVFFIQKYAEHQCAFWTKLQGL